MGHSLYCFDEEVVGAGTENGVNKLPPRVCRSGMCVGRHRDE